MHRDLCGGRPSLCDAMKPTKGADLLKYLRKVQFQGKSGFLLRFIKKKKYYNKNKEFWVLLARFYRIYILVYD